MVKVIIEADDFGMSEAINLGIIKSFRDGITTSTLLMPNLDAAVHAVALSKDYPELCLLGSIRIFCLVSHVQIRERSLH